MVYSRRELSFTLEISASNHQFRKYSVCIPNLLTDFSFVNAFGALAFFVIALLEAIIFKAPTR